MGVRVVLAAVCAVVALSNAEAYKIFQKKLPNGANVPEVEAIGHKGGVGGPNNNFGLDFIEARFRWTKKFCETDSDGDGQTNGQELGDPCCEFVFEANEKVRWTEGVSHPGNPKRMSDPALWEGIVCGVDAAEPEAAAKAEATGELKQEKAEEKKETVRLAAKETANQQELTAGAPALHASVMLSAGTLTALVIYVVAMRSGRRRSLPIFRRRREHQ